MSVESSPGPLLPIPPDKSSPVHLQKGRSTPKSLPSNPSPRFFGNAIENKLEREISPRHSYTRSIPKEANLTKIAETSIAAPAEQQPITPVPAAKSRELEEIERSAKLYSNARMERETLENSALHPLLKDHLKLQNKLITSSNQLSQKLSNKPRLKQLIIHKKLLNKCQKRLPESASPALKQMKAVFQKELHAFLVLEAFTYRHFEAERKGIEKECAALNAPDNEKPDLVQFLGHWHQLRKNLDNAENFENQRKLQNKKPMDSFESRKNWLVQLAAHIELYRQIKDFEVKKPENDKNSAVKEQLESIQKLQKAINRELNAVTEYLVAKQLKDLP